jgi:Lysine methyltransferase
MVRQCLFSEAQLHVDVDRDAALGCLLCFQDLVRARTPLSSLTKALQSNDSKQIKILELGAGCGMVGIALAQSFGNCAVQLTDQANAQDILFRNMEQARPAKNSSLQHRILDWDVDSGEASLERDLSLIVISDCTYNADSCPDLVRTVAQASSTSPGVRILVAMKRRHDSEEIFFELMRDAHMHILEQITIELPSESSSVMEARPSEIELYAYCLMGSGESTSVGL